MTMIPAVSGSEKNEFLLESYEPVLENMPPVVITSQTDRAII